MSQGTPAGRPATHITVTFCNAGKTDEVRRVGLRDKNLRITSSLCLFHRQHTHRRTVHDKQRLEDSVSVIEVLERPKTAGFSPIEGSS